MNYTKLFDIQWDDSYNDPDFGIPGTFQKWLDSHPDPKQIAERLAQMLEFLAKSLRERTDPFGPIPDMPNTGDCQTTPNQEIIG